MSCICGQQKWSSDKYSLVTVYIKDTFKKSFSNACMHVKLLCIERWVAGMFEMHVFYLNVVTFITAKCAPQDIATCMQNNTFILALMLSYTSYILWVQSCVYL